MIAVQLPAFGFLLVHSLHFGPRLMVLIYFLFIFGFWFMLLGLFSFVPFYDCLSFFDLIVGLNDDILYVPMKGMRIS